MSTTKKPSSKKFKKTIPPQIKKEKSPNISRLFTDKSDHSSPLGIRKIPDLKQIFSFFFNKYALTIYISLVAFGLLAIQGIRLNERYVLLAGLESKKEHLQKEVIYWEEIANTHTNYRDAYFKLSLLKYQLGDLTTMRLYLDKALEIDPNFEPALNFEEELSTTYSP